jgi:hypothetical protein
MGPRPPGTRWHARGREPAKRGEAPKTLQVLITLIIPWIFFGDVVPRQQHLRAALFLFLFLRPQYSTGTAKLLTSEST